MDMSTVKKRRLAALESSHRVRTTYQAAERRGNVSVAERGDKSPTPGGHAKTPKRRSETRSDVETPAIALHPIYGVVDVQQPVLSALKPPASQPRPPGQRTVLSTLVSELIGTNPKGISVQSTLLHRVADKHILLDNPTTDLGKSKHVPKMRVAAATRKLAKKRRTLLHLEGGSYEAYQALHQLWSAYALRLLGADASKAADLVSALDFHGAKLQVTESRDPQLVGVEGIVVQECERVFRVVTPASRLVNVDKRCSFRVTAGPSMRFVLRGGCVRAAGGHSG